MFYSYRIRLIIINVMLLVPDANWICNLKDKQFLGVAVAMLLGRTGSEVSRLGESEEDLSCGVLLLLIYHGLFIQVCLKPFELQTSSSVHAVCTPLHRNPLPGGGSPCTLLKVTITAAQHL